MPKYHHRRGEPWTRRQMLRTSALGAATVWTTAKSWGGEAPSSPNEKLNIAGIGVGGQGGWDVGECASQNIVALCDVDDRRAAGNYQRFPKAKRFRDFRKMLDQIHGEMDAVVVGTPDHTHAPAAVAAMSLGKHCYCEKPLAHCVYEVRKMIELSIAKKLSLIHI